MKQHIHRLSSALLALCLLAGGCSSGDSSGAKPSGSSKGGDSKGGNTKSGGSSGGAASGQGSQDSADTQKTINVTTDQQQVAGIRVEMVEPRSVPRLLTVPGQIMMDEQHTAHIASYADGRVVEILKQPGDVVRRGETLARLHSHSVHETVGALAQAFANVERQKAAVVYAQQKRDRYNHLYSIQAASLEQKQGSEQELVQAQTDLNNVQASVTMEREHLGDLLNEEPNSITPANLYRHDEVPIVSPIAGTVITRSVTPGVVLEPGVEAFTVSNLTSVWMVAAVSEVELPLLRVGEHVEVRSDAWPGRSFSGTVTLIGSTLDPATRTLQVRASLANPLTALKPQMFVTATITKSKRHPGTASESVNAQDDLRKAIFIPEVSLQEVNGVQVVFVTNDGTHFTSRALQIQPPVNGQVEVTSGLHAGERIAVAGAFMLKSELLKGTLGEE